MCDRYGKGKFVQMEALSARYYFVNCTLVQYNLIFRDLVEMMRNQDYPTIMLEIYMLYFLFHYLCTKTKKYAILSVES